MCFVEEDHLFMVKVQSRTETNKSKPYRHFPRRFLLLRLDYSIATLRCACASRCIGPFSCFFIPSPASEAPTWFGFTSVHVDIILDTCIARVSSVSRFPSARLSVVVFGYPVASVIEHWNEFPVFEKRTLPKNIWHQLTYLKRKKLFVPERVPWVEQRRLSSRFVILSESSQLHCFPWFDVRRWDGHATEDLIIEYIFQTTGTNLEAPGFFLKTLKTFHLGGNFFEILFHLLTQTQIETSKICESCYP